jgi:hypothetical protein
MPSIAALLVATLAAAPQRLDLSEKALVSRASQYVAEYEKQFAFLIADETYQQRQFGADRQLLRTRNMRSELFVTYLAADDEWIAVRDVIEVDGQAVTRTDLRTVLAKSEQIRGAIKDVIARNAQYNIGLERNFNEPTLALLLLDAKRTGRIRFTRRAVVRDGAETLVTLGFEERERPTLVSSREGMALPSRGEFVIDAATGTVKRTVFQLTRPGIDAKLETTYTRDDRLGLWLPSVFMERYESGTSVGRRPRRDEIASYELIECEAAYSNYRRFDVIGRIKR